MFQNFSKIKLKSQIRKEVQIRQILKPFNSKYSRWYTSPKYFINFLKDILAYREELNLFYYNLDTYLTTKEQSEQAKLERFIPKEITIKPKELEISGQFIRTFYLADLPPVAAISQLSIILNLSIPFTLSYHIQGTKKSQIISRGNSKISTLEAQLITEQERGKYRNKEVEKHIDEINHFIDDIINGSDEAFYFTMFVTVSGENKEELEAYCKIFKEETQDIQYQFNNCYLNQYRALLNTLPLVNYLDNQNNATNKNNQTYPQHLLHTSAVANILPFLSKNQTDHEGIFLGSNLHNGSLVLVDLFKTNNNNFNIFGKSGSGKSVTSKLIISRLLLRGIQNVIIDPEGEYTNLATAYGGETIEFSREKGINPFYIYTDFDNNSPLHLTGEQEQNQILVLKEFFKFFIAPSKFDSGLLGSILTEYFNKTKAEKRNLPDFLKYITKKDKNLPFTEDLLELADKRSLGGFFNSTGTVNLASELITCNLRKLEADEVKIPAMFLLCNLVQKLADDLSKKTLIYVDEAHLLLKYKITGNFLQTLSKTVRKRNTGLVCISQELEDFKEENGGKSIIAQAESNFVLKQASVSINHIKSQNILPLTEDELRQLTTLNQGQCIYLRQNEHMFLQVIPFEEEKDLVFTNLKPELLDNQSIILE